MKIDITRMLEDASQNVTDAIKIAALALNFRHHFTEGAFCEAYYWLHWWKKMLDKDMPPEGDALLNQFAVILKDVQNDIDELFSHMDEITDTVYEAMEEEIAKEAQYPPEKDATHLKNMELLWNFAFLSANSNDYVS